MNLSVKYCGRFNVLPIPYILNNSQFQLSLYDKSKFIKMNIVSFNKQKRRTEVRLFVSFHMFYFL